MTSLDQELDNIYTFQNFQNGLSFIDDLKENQLQKFGNDTSCKATVITAYFEFRSKRSHDTYLNWMENFLTFTDCMVIFVEKNMIR